MLLRLRSVLRLYRTVLPAGVHLLHARVSPARSSTPHQQQQQQQEQQQQQQQLARQTQATLVTMPRSSSTSSG
jgi:hypothetical protein